MKANLIQEMVERLRMLGGLDCLDQVAQKLTEISARTIDEKFEHQKETLKQLQRKDQLKQRSLLLKKIPIKIHGELDNQQIGDIQIGYVEHCGNLVAGEFVCAIDTADIAFGWEEWEAVMGRGQIPTKEGLDRDRFRFPLFWLEIRFDGDKGT